MNAIVSTHIDGLTPKFGIWQVNKYISTQKYNYQVKLQNKILTTFAREHHSRTLHAWIAYIVGI
jgi:hypothetical protein